MAVKPLTSQAITLTEKKMDMSLDDIIKMSKNRGMKPNKQRVSNKGQKSFNNASQDKGLKVKRFMDTRTSLRQGALAKRRSNSQGNQFPLATEAAKKASVAPIRNKASYRIRPLNANKSRAGASTFQRNAAARVAFVVKKPLQQPAQQASLGTKLKPQTLDALFGNMKEERMRVLSQQTNGSRRYGRSQHGVPWARGYNQNE